MQVGYLGMVSDSLVYAGNYRGLKEGGCGVGRKRVVQSEGESEKVACALEVFVARRWVSWAQMVRAWDWVICECTGDKCIRFVPPVEGL